MDYYILQLYQDRKKKSSEVMQGLSRFDYKTKMLAIGALGILLIGSLETIITLIIYSTQFWYFIGLVLCIIAVAMLFLIDYRDQKKHLDKYVVSYKCSIDILYDILCDEFKINNREKIEELIQFYQDYLDKESEKTKIQNKIIYTFFSVLAGMLSILFVNLDIIGIDFTTWIYFVIILILFIFDAGAVIFLFSYIDTTKENYQMMIKKLRGVLLMKF